VTALVFFVDKHKYNGGRVVDDFTARSAGIHGFRALCMEEQHLGVDRRLYHRHGHKGADRKRVEARRCADDSAIVRENHEEAVAVGACGGADHVVRITRVDPARAPQMGGRFDHDVRYRDVHYGLDGRKGEVCDRVSVNSDREQVVERFTLERCVKKYKSKTMIWTMTSSR